MTDRPIALIGMRCSGKSSVGRLLAQRLGRPFVDLDAEVVRFSRHAGHGAETVGRLLTRVGQATFRELEAAALRKLLEPSLRIVLATGGGVVERADSRSWLVRVPLCIWLSVPPEHLQERLRRDAAERPPLLGEDAVAEVPAVLRRREGWYRRTADLIVDCGDRGADVLAGQILDELPSE